MTTPGLKTLTAAERWVRLLKQELVSLVPIIPTLALVLHLSATRTVQVTSIITGTIAFISGAQNFLEHKGVMK